MQVYRCSPRRRRAECALGALLLVAPLLAAGQPVAPAAVGLDPAPRPEVVAAAEPDATAGLEYAAVREAALRALRLCRQPEAAWDAVRQESVEPPSFASPAAAAPVIHAMAAAGGPQARARALEAWGASNDPARSAYCLEGLLDAEPVVYTAALRCLEGAPPDAVTDWLIPVLIPQAPEAFPGVVALLQARHAVLAPLLQARLLQANLPADARCAAARALGASASSDASAALADVAGGPDPDLAVCAAEALAALRDPAALTRWRELVDAADPRIRRLALDAFAGMGARDDLEILFQVAAGDRDWELSLERYAVELLAQLAPADAVPALVAVLRRNPRVTVRTAELLRALTGVDLGESAELWEQWLRGEPEGEGPGPQTPEEALEVDKLPRVPPIGAGP